MLKGFFIGYIIGGLVGCFLGCLVMACVVIASRSDDNDKDN